MAATVVVGCQHQREVSGTESPDRRRGGVVAVSMDKVELAPMLSHPPPESRGDFVSPTVRQGGEGLDLHSIFIKFSPGSFALGQDGHLYSGLR